MENYMIEMLNITKRFPGVIANNNVTVQVKKGEIHALLGENGAGKSTLMSVLFGLYRPDEGRILINGKPVRIQNPNDANRYGIGMVHQHFKLVGNFTVLENIVLGVETTRGGLLKMDNARKEVAALSERYNLSIDLDAYVDDITVGMQQRVEILKMLYRENNILIFDEPTAVLTPQEIAELMGIMKELAAEGKSILFITHKLDEIKQVASRCTILRKGEYIDCVDVADTSKEDLSELMVGRKVNLTVDKTAAEPKDVVLNVKGLSVKDPVSNKNKVNNVDFSVKQGEIVCIAGIDGNGQTELIEAITGLNDSYKGTVTLNGDVISDKSIKYRNMNGISYIPEDRHKHGLVLDYDIADNLVLKEFVCSEFQSGGFLNQREILRNAEEKIEQYDIRCGQGPYTETSGMSGGNQQKVILAREIEREHSLLIAVQPARGLDVGAIEQVHKQLVAQRDRGKGVLLVSLELDEVMDVSDRILVIYEGELVAEVTPQETSRQELGLFMSGAKKGVVQHATQ